MGVRGIFSLLRKNLSSYSTRKEYFAGEVVNEEGDRAGKQREVLVVDGNAFVYWFVTFALGKQSLCLTDYEVLSRKLEEWLLQCSLHHLELVFVFDGITQPSKWTTKIMRMKKQAQDIYSNQRHKLEGGDKNLAPSMASTPPLLGMQAVLHILMKYECDAEDSFVQVIFADGEADEEVVREAVERKALAILSNDSDMLFFHFQNVSHTSSPCAAYHSMRNTEPIATPLLPFSSCQFSEGGYHLVLDSLIQRQCLAKALGVHSKHLWVLAALVGHDNSEFDIVAQVHRHLRDRATTQSSLSSRTWSMFSWEHRERHVGKSHDDWIDSDVSPSKRSLNTKKKKNIKSSKNNRKTHLKKLSSSEIQDQTVNPPLCGEPVAKHNRENIFRSACNSSSSADNYIMSSQDTLKSAAKLMANVYKNVENSTDLFTSDIFFEFGPIHTSNDIYDNMTLLCFCVISVLLMVPVVGVKEAVMSRRDDLSPTSNIESEQINQSLPWCVSTSRTADSCCRLFDYLKSTFDMYTISVDVTSPIKCGNDNDSGPSNKMPWDLRMVLKHHIYLPRLNYEYSDWEHFSHLISHDHQAEKNFAGLYVDKALRGVLRKHLFESLSFENLRHIRTLIYQRIHHDNSSAVIMEVLRKGQCLDVVSVWLHIGCSDITDADGSVYAEFINILLHTSLRDLLVEGKQTFGASQSLCSVCQQLFSLRCLQLKVFVKVVEAAFGASGSDDPCIRQGCYPIQLSIILLVFRHLCDECVSSTCCCFKKCQVDPLSALFESISLGQSVNSEILAEFEHSHMWASIQVCILHVEYLLYCSWSCSNDLHNEGNCSDSLNDIQFPYKCLSPSVFVGLYSEFLSKRNSPGANATIWSHIDKKNLGESHLKSIFLMFADTAMS